MSSFVNFSFYKNYKTVKCEDEKFKKNIEKHLDMGYVLHGPPVVSKIYFDTANLTYPQHVAGYLFTQFMVKYNYPPPPS